MKKILILALVVVFMNSCAIREVIDLSQNGNTPKAPRWNMKFKVPIIKRTENMNEYFSIKSMFSIIITMPAITSFNYLPANTALDNIPVVPGLMPDQSAITPQVISTPIMIDFDGDGHNDVLLNEIKGKNGYLQIEMSQKIDGNPTPFEVGDIALTGIEIEGTIYPFKQPTVVTSKGTLVFKTNTFLVNNGIRPDATGSPDEIDIKLTPDLVLFNTAHKHSAMDELTDLTDPIQIDTLVSNVTTHSYEYTFGVTFNLGKGFEIKGFIANEKPLFELKNVDVPLTANQSIIKSFEIFMETDNHLPIVLQIKNGRFHNSNFDIPLIQTLSDDTTTDEILIPSGMQFATLETASSIFNKGKLKMDLDLVIPANANIIVSNNSYITFGIGISGEAKVDLDIF